MKKLIVVIVLLVMLVGTPITQAATQDELNQQLISLLKQVIALLMQQVEELQKQLLAQQQRESQSPQPTISTPSQVTSNQATSSQQVSPSVVPSTPHYELKVASFTSADITGPGSHYRIIAEFVGTDGAPTFFDEGQLKIWIICRASPGEYCSNYRITLHPVLYEDYYKKTPNPFRFEYFLFKGYVLKPEDRDNYFLVANYKGIYEISLIDQPW